MQTSFRLDDPALKHDQLQAIAAQASQAKVKIIFVTPLFTKLVAQSLTDVSTTICTIIGSNPGYSVVEAKIAELVMALVDGATAIEFGVNTNAIINNDWQYLAGELNHLMKVAGSKQIPLLVNINSQWLDEQQLAACCDLYGAAGIKAICLNDNFLDATAVLKKVSFVRQRLADAVEICLTQAVKNDTFAAELVAAGANGIVIPYTSH
jgi:deoxyribose-phosphate aldolase